jgi:GMP synthase-like glutamine amidotransferase
MRIGVLNSIPPIKSRVKWGGTPVEAYIRFLETAGPGFLYEGYEVAQGELPYSPEACDAYVITGSPKGVYEVDEWISALALFIRDAFRAGKKLVGICFGHQILAQALGGDVEKSEKGWGIGLHTIEINRTPEWMTGNPDHCSLYFVHQDQVVDLPPGADLLGGNAFCPNAFYTIGDQVFSLQGHPEFSDDIMRDLLVELRGTVDDAILSSAAQTLDRSTPDNQLVVRWIINFLTETSVRPARDGQPT